MSSDGPIPSEPFLSVEEFRDLTNHRLSMKLLAGEEGLQKEINSPRIQKLGLALAGYTEYLQQGRVQFIGLSEITFLKMLSPEEREVAVERIFSREITCVVVTQNLEAPEDLLQKCNEHWVPVFQTETPSSIAIAEITTLLEESLAPTTTVHGVLMEVFGIGVLLLGPSGIGKSECALDLILRGHRLVSDDTIVIKRFGINQLQGSGPRDFRFHMELRGLGIINIKELFGVSALSSSKTVDLTVDLVRWKNDEEYDRLGLDEREYTLLGIPVPVIRMPVAPGRNLATLVEVAVRIQMLKAQGYSASNEFFQKLEEHLKAPELSSDEAQRL